MRDKKDWMDNDELYRYAEELEGAVNMIRTISLKALNSMIDNESALSKIYNLTGEFCDD